MSEEDQTPADVAGALRDMLATPGWKILTDHIDATWGPKGYGIEMQRAIASVPVGPDRAYQIAEIAERVDATARAINDLKLWPAEYIKRLTPQAPSRRPFDRLRRSS